MGEVARDAAGNSAKLFFPAAERNCEPIAQCLLRLLGAMQPLRVLEVASGSGQHICRFAQLMPRARFVPSEVEPSYRDWWEPGIHQRLRWH